MSIGNLTVNNLIIDALNLVDLFTEDRTPPARFINDGIRYLNTITSEFERDNILIPYNETLSFIATINKGKYYISLDSGADIPYSKPCYIAMAQLNYNNALFPLKKMVDADWYERFGVKGQAGQPVWWNYQRGATGSTFYLYPAPSMAYTVNIKGKFSMDNWTINDSLNSLDPGYYEFLMHCLARRYSKVYKTAIWNQIMEDDYREMRGLFKATNDADWNMKLLISSDTGFSGWLVSPQ